MKVYDTGCPICGLDFGEWTLIVQLGHVMHFHTWRERWSLYRATHQPVGELLIYRHSMPKRVAVEPPPVGSGGTAPSRPPG